MKVKYEILPSIDGIDRLKYIRTRRIFGEIVREERIIQFGDNWVQTGEWRRVS